MQANATIGKCAFVSDRFPTVGAVGWPGLSGTQEVGVTKAWHVPEDGKGVTHDLL